jgi:hypothetical protein
MIVRTIRCDAPGCTKKEDDATLPPGWFALDFELRQMDGPAPAANRPLHACSRVHLLQALSHFMDLSDPAPHAAPR